MFHLPFFGPPNDLWVSSIAGVGPKREKGRDMILAPVMPVGIHPLFSPGTPCCQLTQSFLELLLLLHAPHHYPTCGTSPKAHNGGLTSCHQKGPCTAGTLVPAAQDPDSMGPSVTEGRVVHHMLSQENSSHLSG